MKNANGVLLLILSGLKTIGFGSFSRKGAKTLRSELMSFRPKGEIFPRSLAFARDDGHRLVILCGLASLREIFPLQCFRENSETDFGYSLSAKRRKATMFVDFS